MSTRYRYTSMGTSHIVETYRDHTRSAQRAQHYGRIEPMVEPYDYRKGTIRGFGAVLLVIAAVVGFWSMLP